MSTSGPSYTDTEVVEVVEDDGLDEEDLAFEDEDAGDEALED